MKRVIRIGVFGGMMFLLLNACSKEMPASGSTSGSIYIPTVSDVTVTATLTELKEGRTLYVNNCGACHGLYSPDSFSSSSWSNILSNMAPRTGLSSADAELVLKYVTRGK